MPTRPGRRRTLTKPQKIERRKKTLVVLDSEIRTYHAQIAELEDKVVHAERLRAETQRELEELESSAA